jgi:hypothetical protein
LSCSIPERRLQTGNQEQGSNHTNQPGNHQENEDEKHTHHLRSGLLSGYCNDSIRSGPLLYEGFDYSVSKEANHASLSGANGGTGWDGDWKETKWPMAAAMEPGLAFGRLGVKGNAATSTAYSWGHATRATGGTLSQAGLLNNGATLWFSIVIDNSAASSGVKNGLALGTGSFSGDAQDKISQGAFGVGLLQSGCAKVAAAYWSGGSLITGDTGIYPTEAVLFVGKIAWGGTDEADETLTIHAPALI